MTTPAEDAVTRAVWPWRGGGLPAGGRRRWPRAARAALDALPILAIAALLHFRFHAPLAAAAVCAAGVLLALGGACSPSLFRAFERFRSSLGRAAGLALTWILLGAVFFACFVPGRLVLVLCRRDPLRRKAVPGRSAWIARGEEPEPARYERHY